VGRGVVVKLEGAAQLRRTLRAAGDDLSDLKRAHQAAADVVAPAARSGAPFLTGRLSGSVRGSGTKTAALVRAGSARVPYAGVQEYGWPARGIPAQAYLVPAAEATETTWYGAYLAEVDRIVGRIKGV
jgi:hypothetical protein